jgi:subtilisin family serine protease
MPVRLVPSRGDEFDKDVALAIRYAVDNGAKVINISFAKRFSSNPKWVSRAIRYAGKKDVLIVKAAGNDGIDTDSIPFYPTVYAARTKKRFANMIVVAASGPRSENIVATFSNYGRHSVDVFAPGLDIYSTIPDDQYGIFSGTSMAAPVVTGVAAIIRANFPDLTARQVKSIILNSVQRIDFPVTIPGDSIARNRMNDLCQSGGIVNASNAVRLAMIQTRSKIKRK